MPRAAGRNSRGLRRNRALSDRPKSVRPSFGTFRKFFPLFVLLTFITLFLIEHSRPSRSALPVFEPTQRVELESLSLPRGEHALTGRVLTSSGEPADNVLIELVQSGEPHWTYSDSRGHFKMSGLFAGEVVASLTQAKSPPQRITVELPSESVEWRLSVEFGPLETLPHAQRSALFGNITSALGSSVESYQLVLEPTARNKPFSIAILRRVPVGVNGAYAIADLALGDYTVYVLPAWAAGGSWPRLVSFQYEHLASAVNLDLTLESSELEGTLSLAETEAPLTGAQVLAWNSSRPSQLWEPVLTDQTGHFKIADLPAGDYTIEVRAGGLTLNQSIKIAPKRRISIEFEPIDLSNSGTRSEQ
ncbi:MAG: hypothetical protein ACI8TQ_002125 [Planctomycetota bacterium]|jgi:hypothetical protein